MNKEHPVKSPCIDQCCLNPDDVCVGCYRTLDEILDWSCSTNEQKIAILQSCEKRRKQHGSSSV
ncbi:DUF1289 domain-containing protein [Pseudoalteromonas pernae]|uniref:DUF1289 domain-containing protein n=1 Tax=Pseudoalteromonas pernae TaxID=3118054 RepID=UPI003241BABD